MYLNMSTCMHLCTYIVYVGNFGKNAFESMFFINDLIDLQNLLKVHHSFQFALKEQSIRKYSSSFRRFCHFLHLVLFSVAVCIDWRKKKTPPCLPVIVHRPNNYNYSIHYPVCPLYTVQMYKISRVSILFFSQPPGFWTEFSLSRRSSSRSVQYAEP